MQTEPLIIYHNTKPLCRAEKWTFYDKVQSVGGQYISTTIKSPVPITFSIGDYCEYRGERYYMNNLPSVTQQAKPKEYGDGFVYDNVRFDGAGFELCRILMLDITPTTGLYIPKKGTNYTGSSNFQLYCAETRLTVDGIERIYPAVCTLAGKIQANLDRAYPTSGWKILVDTTTTHEVKGNTELRTHTDDKILSFNNTTVANALAEVNNTFKLNFHIKGRTIYIGYTLGAVTGNFMGNSGVVGDNDYYYLGYGRGYADKEHPGRGLYEIKKSADTNQQIITRLRAMGSTKNMPFRYYNKRYDLSQDLYPANLQLPDTFKPPLEKHAGHERRKTINKSVYEVLGETNDAYLEKYNDIKRCKEGLREGVAIWDGSNGLPEIYPTIERMTYGELRGNNCADMLGKTESGSGAQVNGHSSFYYYDNNERVDEILAVGKLTGTTLSDDANFGNGLLQPDTLEESSNIDCPCNVKSSFSVSYLQNKIDRGYDLFPPIRMQAAGKYILSPEAPSLRAEVSINTGRHESGGKHASGLCYYEIILSSVSLKDNQRTTIGKYVSEKKAVSSGQPCLIELPKLPDLFDDKKEEGTKYDAQIKAIQLNGVSDVYASIVFHVEDIKRDVQDNVYLTVYAGKPSFGKEASVMKDSPSVYVWSPSTEDKKDINKPFHVIIKDIGISQFVSQFSGGEQPMLSMKDGNCLGRNFLIGKDVKRVTYTKNGNTYNGWQLELTRAADDSIHRYYPNQTDRLQAGDHYVLLGIPMPDAYVQAAEMRLLVAASQYLRDNSRTKYNYEPKVDELFLARNYDRCESMNAKEQSIYWNLYAGLRLPFFGSPNTDNADEELPLVNIPIESLTIKEGDGIIPKVELHLREGSSQSSIQQISARIDALYDGMNRGNGGMTLSDTNTAIFRTGVKYFLRKDIADTAEQVIIFLKGIIAKAISYFNGIENNGNFRNKGDITNTGCIMTNNLTVTGKATFFELEIQKAKAAGGMSVNSAGTFHIDAVEVTPDGFVCYQRAEKDGVKLLQTCEPKDQMMCSNGMNSLLLQPPPTPPKEGGSQGRGDQTKDGKPHAIGNHYYWRLATEAPKEVVMHTIDGKEEKCLKLVLSKTDRHKLKNESPQDIGDIPKVGDDLVQVGNRDNKERQSVMMSCAYNSFDPDLKPSYWAHYMGVNDYDISKHRYTWFAANGSQVTGNFKVQSDNGGLESIEDYMKGLASENSSVLYKLVMSSSQFNVKADGSLSPQFISIYAYKVQGENLTQLSPSEKVSVRVTKGENELPIKENSVVVRSDKWNLWAKKEDMTDVFNVDLIINDNVVDKQKLVDMQKIHVVREGQDGRDGHSLVTKVFMEGSYRNGFTKGVKSYVKVYYDGQEVTDFKASYRYKGGGFSDWSATEIKSSDAWGDAQRDGSTLYVEYAVEYKGLKALATGRLDNIQDGKKGSDAVSYNLIPMQEAAVAYKADSGKKLVRLFLAYKIQKTVGEVTRELALGEEGIKLSVAGITKTFVSIGGAYVLDKKDVEYKETNIDTYIVTLKKGSDIVDQRIVPITFKPKVVFDIDTVNGKITSQIEAANGKINSVERDLNQTKATVGELDGKYSQLKMKSDEISLTVNNGTRPNLLWGSDLDLSEMQDKIQLAYKQGTDIKQKTAEKENLQRQLDATSTNDTAKRNDLQKKIDICNDAITAAKNKVSECKAAIEKHLGVGLNVTKVDNTERFEYLKGGGVACADAIKAKVTAVNDDGNYYAGLYWQIGFGAKSNVKVKPNTEYTFSFWIRTEILQGSGYAVVESFNMESLSGGRKDRTMPWTDVKATNEWERKSYTFTTGATGYIMVGVGLSGSPNFSGLIYLCRPKLEEGNTATPWCAYDGTVDALKRTGIDILTGEIVLDADKTTVKGDLTAKSLQTEGDPAKGGGTVVAKDGVITFYGVNKSVPGIEIGLNEAGEPVLKMYKNGKFMYDLGPDTIFEQVIERENGFTPCDMHRICNTVGNDMEKSFGVNFPNNYRTMVAYVFSEGYKRVGNQTRYKVSETKEISTYNGVHFVEQRSVSGITADQLESMSRIADGWYLNGGGPRVSDSSAPAYDGSNPQGYTCRRFGVRYYSNGKATSKLGSFTVCGNSQTGWTVEKIDIPFL